MGWNDGTLLCVCMPSNGNCHHAPVQGHYVPNINELSTTYPDGSSVTFVKTKVGGRWKFRDRIDPEIGERIVY